MKETINLLDIFKLNMCHKLLEFFRLIPLQKRKKKQENSIISKNLYKVSDGKFKRLKKCS